MPFAPHRGRDTREIPATAAGPGVVKVRPPTRTRSTEQVRTVGTTWVICQLQNRFSQFPRWSRAMGKKASANRVRPPRMRRATRIMAKASAAKSVMLTNMPTRKSP
jgi:hypothetical protein